MSNHIKASELNHCNSQKKTVITADGQLAQVYQFHNSLCLGIPYPNKTLQKKISVEEKGKHLIVITYFNKHEHFCVHPKAKLKSKTSATKK